MASAATRAPSKVLVTASHTQVLAPASPITTRDRDRTVYKRDLMALVQQAMPSLPRESVESIFQLIWEEIGARLAAGESVRIPRFGTLRLQSAAPRLGRNPRTGYRIEIPTRSMVRFSAAGQLRNQLFLGAASVGYESGREPEPPGPPLEPRSSHEIPRDREIGVWLAVDLEEPEPPVTPPPVLLGAESIVCFRVGPPVAHNLASGEVVLRADDVPAEGLDTDWRISAKVPLRALDPNVEVDERKTADGIHYFARFRLHIPQSGVSLVRRLAVRADSASSELRAAIYVIGPQQYQSEGSPFHNQELFREITITLSSSSLKRKDLNFTRLRYTGLRTPHENQTPEGASLLRIRPPVAELIAQADNDSRDTPSLPWDANEAVLAGPITEVRRAALRLWTDHEDHFNAIDDTLYDLGLEEYRYPGSWSNLPDRARSEARTRWAEIATSDALLDLADAGHRLGMELFPRDSELRRWLSCRKPGHFLNCSWSQTGDGGISHVPWGLVYLPDLQAPGEPIDPLGFLGLRFRLRYSKRPLDGRRGLGKLGLSSDPVAARLGFFWGSTDPAAEEADWQRARWHDWPGFRFVPTTGAATDPKAEVRSFMVQPGETERVLYFFCHGSSDALRFGDTNGPEQRFRLAELPTSAFADPPFIFLNACGSVGGDDPLRVHEIERRFAQRKCRAYLGAEIKVPIRFASRFADTFFHFFTRRHDDKPMSAGEALAQTRLFFWSHFKNLGGLFYSLVDESEIFLATPEEVSALRFPH